MSSEPPPPRRITVAEYHRLGELGILTPDDRVELLEGLVVERPRKSPPHVVATSITEEALQTVLPRGWHIASHDPVTLGNSEPEPDLSVTRGHYLDYRERHPGPDDVAVVIEITDTDLPRDRDWKRRIYARNGIPVYWIVNLVDRVLEVYADPSGPVLTPDYATAKFLTPADKVDVVIAGTAVGAVAVADLFP